MIETVRARAKLAGRLLHQRRKLQYLLTTRSGLRALRYMIAPPKHGAFTYGTGAIGARQYGSYNDYVRHQRSKLGLVDLREYDRTFRANLASRLKKADWAGKSVLCLAARIGTEVRAFHDVGAFAVGIDLEPGETNEWVLPGDFHNLVFPDACVDGIYCNSLDHALDLGKLLSEVKRVLKPEGLLLVDAQHGDQEFDDWAATAWRSVDDLIAAIAASGFHLEHRRPVSVPQPGEELQFAAPSQQGDAAET